MSSIFKSALKNSLIFSSLSTLSLSALSEGPSLPSLTCTDSISAYTQGCTVSAPEGVPSTADIGVKLFSHSLVDTTIEQQVLDGLDKVVVYLGGYGGFNLESLDMQALEQLRQDGVSIIQVQTGTAGDDTVEHYSQQIQATISQINQFRQGLSNPTEMVVIGYSLGGIGARHALASMEKNNIPHNMSTYISFDAPHKGANIPQSIQQIKFILDEYLDESQPYAAGVSAVFNQPVNQINNIYDSARDTLNNLKDGYVGAGIFKQLLTNNVFATGDEFTDFATSYAQLGYPQQTRNIAVSNGSLQIDQNGYGNGDLLGRFSAKTSQNTYAKVDLDVYDSQPSKTAVGMNLNLTGTVQGTYKCFIFFTCTQTIAVGGNLPKSRSSSADIMALDSVPGSTSGNITTVLDGLTKFSASNGFVILDSPYYNKSTGQIIPVDSSNSIDFSFVPTASAIGLPITSSKDDLLQAVSSNATPFDKVIIKGDSTYGGVTNANLSHYDLNLTPDLANEIKTALALH